MMIFKFWIIVNDCGGVSTRKNRPSFAEGEVGIPMTVRVPGAWFSRQTNVMDIAIPEPANPPLEMETGDIESPNWNPATDLQARGGERINDPR